MFVLLLGEAVMIRESTIGDKDHSFAAVTASIHDSLLYIRWGPKVV